MFTILGTQNPIPMAFTMEQIEKTIFTNNSLVFDADVLRKDPGYIRVTDYLTGKTTSLPSGVLSVGLHCWRGLIQLLQNIEHPSANDQILLGVISHPGMDSFVHKGLVEWLDAYLISHMSESAFRAVLALMKNTGADDEHIFKHLLFETAARYYKTFAYSDSPLLDYLAGEVRKHDTLVQSYDWSLAYFWVIEKEKPALLKDYMRAGILFNQQYSVDNLLAHQHGKYMADIQELVAAMTVDKRTHHPFIQTVLRIYEKDTVKYASFAVQQAVRYLDFYQVTPFDSNESRWSFGEFVEAGKELTFPHSTCAFYLLFKYERAAGIEKYQQFTKKKLEASILRVLILFLQNDALPYLQEAVLEDQAGLDFTQTAVALLTSHFEPAAYLPALWAAAGSKLLLLRNQLAAILAKEDAEAEAKAIALLNHKKADARQTALAILSHFDTAATREAIIGLLNKESNDTVRDILLESFRIPEEMDIPAMVAAARSRGKLDKPVESWLEETELPGLYYSNGAQLDADTTRFLLYRMSRAKGMRSDIEAKLIIQKLDRDRNTPFAKKILQLFVEKEGKPDLKYILTLAALLGNEEIVDKLRSTINSWIEANRLVMAENGIGALALQGSDKALRCIELYSRKFSSKKANVGAAALRALEAAAEELNITAYELADRIVPDFGFNGVFREFTAAGSTYRAFIDSNFKIVFFDENNKKLKSLPAAADAELKDEFKAIAKEVKDVVKSQSSRLEHYLVIQRKWTAAQWHAIFLNNPVMFIYATKIVWGAYDSDGRLLQCFLCQEDTALIDFDDNEWELPEGAKVGIVHPLGLTDEQVKQWQQKLFKLSVEPVFPQLDRPVYRVAAEDHNKTVLRDFDKKFTEPNSLKATLDKYGWRKGPAGDGGMVYYFTKKENAGHCMAVIMTEGVSVAGFDTEHYPELGNLYFIDTTKDQAGWFQEPKQDDDSRLIPLGEVPEVFYSEVLAGVSSVKIQK